MVHGSHARRRSSGGRLWQVEGAGKCGPMLGKRLFVTRLTFLISRSPLCSLPGRQTLTSIGHSSAVLGRSARPCPARGSLEGSGSGLSDVRLPASRDAFSVVSICFPLLQLVRLACVARTLGTPTGQNSTEREVPLSRVACARVPGVVCTQTLACTYSFTASHVEMPN